MSEIRVTQTNGNATNKINGGRITIKVGARIVDRFTVPSMYGPVNYCKKHASGQYGKRFYAALEEASRIANEAA